MDIIVLHKSIAMRNKINLTILFTFLWCSDFTASELTFCKSHKDLFSLPYDYNSLLEPVPHVIVGNDLKVLNIVQVNDEQQTITIVIDQVIQWDDKRLVINNSNSYWKADKSYVQIGGKFVEECMWTPKMMFLNLNAMASPNPSANSVSGPPLSIYLFRSGTIMSYRRNAKLTFSCGMEFSNFPFDIQVCYIVEFSEVENGITLKENVTFRPEYQRDLRYDVAVEILGNVSFANGSFDGFVWAVLLQRKLTRVVAQVFTPTTIIVVLSWFSFLIPPDAYPGRVGILVTLILVLINIKLQIIESSPVLSGVCGLTVWTTICLSMVALAMVEYATILLFPVAAGIEKPNRRGFKKCAAKNHVYIPTEMSEDQHLKGCKFEQAKEKDVNHAECNELRSPSFGSNDEKEEDKISRRSSINQCWFQYMNRIDRMAILLLPPIYILICSIYWISYLTRDRLPTKYVSPTEEITEGKLLKLLHQNA